MVLERLPKSVQVMKADIDLDEIVESGFEPLCGGEVEHTKILVIP